jgi:tetratricopeptide (TPR) repeat protein
MDEFNEDYLRDLFGHKDLEEHFKEILPHYDPENQPTPEQIAKVLETIDGLVDTLDYFFQPLVQGQICEAKGSWERAEEHYKKHLTLSPDDVHAWLRLGLMQFRLDKHDDLQETFEQYSKLDPRGASVGKRIVQREDWEYDAIDFFAFQDHLYKQRRDKHLLHFPLVYLENNPDDTKVLHQVYCLYTDNKKFKDAEETIRKLIDLNPDESRYILMLESTLVMQERWEEAVQIMSKYKELEHPNLDSSHEEQLFWKSVFESWCNNYAKDYTKLHGIKWLENHREGFEYNVSEEDKHEKWLELHDTAMAMAPLELETLLDKATGLSPSDPKVHYRRGMLRLTRKDYEGAEASFQKVVALHPAHQAVWFQLGYCQEILQNYVEAEKSFERYTKLNPEHHLGWFHLGQTQGSLGEKQDAIESFRQCLLINSDFEFAKEYIEHLKK